MNITEITKKIKLRNQLTCPHCWQLFSTDQLLWLAESPDLLGDSRLGQAAHQRFLPNRFNENAKALDPDGFACHRLACPNCHLQIPRSFLRMTPLFVSIVGAPAAGKSFFLASMTWRLRKVMTKYFGFNYTDADPEMNLRLQHYESQQFLQGESQSLITIEKTEVYGDIYNTVSLGGQDVAFPQPFTFTMTPTPLHPLANRSEQVSKVLCLYDNAGESFLPGQDTAIRPVTRHLSLSDAIFFLFDPTQDIRFRKVCQSQSKDPQMLINNDRQVRRSPVRQESILTELVNRVRNHQKGGLARQKKVPLVIVLTKADAWDFLIGQNIRQLPLRKIPDMPLCVLDTEFVRTISQKARAIMLKLIPEVVSTAEQLTNDITYIPVSATGGPPSVDPVTNALGFRAGEIQPFCVEVPMLYALSRLTNGIVPTFTRKPEGQS